MRLRVVRRLGVTLAVIGCAVFAAAPAQATFPGQNGKIVFSKDGDLWTVNPDGTDLTQVTSGPDYDTHPRWSPDGSALVFERGPDPYWGAAEGYEGDDIFILDSNGGLSEFGTYAADDFAAAWAPDGQRLVYTTERNAHVEGLVEQPLNLMTANVDGTDRRILLANSFPVTADWSPLGTRIVYSYEYDLAILYGIDPDGANNTQLTPVVNIGDTDLGPSWSPDGKQLAFFRHRGSEDLCVPGPQPNETICTGSSSIFTSDADGGSPTRLTDPAPAIYDSNPAWSPDGSQIAFSRQDDASRIYVMDSDGQNAHVLTEGSQPDWQPLIAPRHLDPPRLLGAPREGRGFAANRGLWLGTPTVAYAYQWSRCDPAGQNCADIDGATDDVYTPAHDDVMGTLRVTVTATNDYGHAAATSEASQIVGESLAGSPEGEVLRGTAGSDLVWGRGGSDTILLGAGDDIGRGGPGGDRLAGGPGNDVLVGGLGRDVFRGGSGRDRIYARDGIRDLIGCGSGRDRVVADHKDVVARSCEIVRFG